MFAYVVLLCFSLFSEPVTVSSPVICYSNLGMIAGGIATAAECGITSQFVQFQRFQVRRVVFLHLPSVTANATIGRRHYLASVRLLV